MKKIGMFLFTLFFVVSLYGQYNATNTESFYANYVIERGDSTDTATDVEAEIDIDGYRVCIEYSEDREATSEDIYTMKVERGPGFLHVYLYTETGYYQLLYNAVVPGSKARFDDVPYFYGMLYVPNKGNQLFFTYVRN